MNNRQLAEFDKMVLEVDRVTKRLPHQLGTIAVSFSKQRFRDQNWVDNYTEPWKMRKADRNKRRTNRKRRGILTKTGRLRRSIRKLKVEENKVWIGTDVPYAQAHNEGVRKTVTVKQHERGRHSKERERYVDRNGRTRNRTVKKQTGTTRVKQHSRKMNLARRQFVGRSAVLDRQMQRFATAQYLKKIR